MVKRFAEDSRRPTRALQAYLVLIGAAANRQVLTYGLLSKNYMKFGQGGIVDEALGCIMGWCVENDLPPLTSIVVNAKSGVPGGGLVTVKPGENPKAIQAVFRFPWYDLIPPTVAQLEAAGRRAALGL